MHQRCAVHQLDRSGCAGRQRQVVGAAGLRNGQYQLRPYARAAGKHGIAHRSCQPRRAAIALLRCQRRFQRRLYAFRVFHDASVPAALWQP